MLLTIRTIGKNDIKYSDDIYNLTLFNDERA